jgi:hypothetical protein
LTVRDPRDVHEETLRRLAKVFPDVESARNYLAFEKMADAIVWDPPTAEERARFEAEHPEAEAEPFEP